MAALLIECQWVLPDMGTAAPGATPSPGSLLYAAPGNPALHDDDPVLGPSPANACGPAGGGAIQPNGVSHAAQVRPNAGDRPSKRSVELWALVRANGTTPPRALTWTVADPSGGHLATVAGTPVPPAACTNLGATGMAGTMLDAAVATGQVASELTTDPVNGIVARCARGEVTVFHAMLQLSYLNTCGAYRLDAAIVSAGSPGLSSSFDDQCFTAIQRDFDRVQWGKVAAGQELRLRGDLTWSDPADAHPTLRNDGNAPASVGVVFDSLVPVDSTGAAIPGGARIERFVACLGKSGDTLRCIAGIAAGTRADFGSQADAVLCPGELARLDLGVVPGAEIAAGGYSGSLRITESPATAVCPALPGG